MCIGFDVKKTSRKLEGKRRKSVFYITFNELYRGPCLHSLWKCEAVRVSRVRRTHQWLRGELCSPEPGVPDTPGSGL